MSSFGIVRFFDISHYSQFRQFSYLSFDINLFRSFIYLIFNFIFYFSLSPFERSSIFKYKTSVILKCYCSKFWPSPSFKLLFSFSNLKELCHTKKNLQHTCKLFCAFLCIRQRLALSYMAVLSLLPSPFRRHSLTQ